MKPYLVVAVSVLCVGWLASRISAVVAPANPKGYKTTISFEITNSTVAGVTRPTIEGKLSSSKAACVKSRLVYGHYNAAPNLGESFELPEVDSNGQGHFTLRAGSASPGSLRKVTIVASTKSLNAHSFCAVATKTKTV
jgi:hypothetical protein